MLAEGAATGTSQRRKNSWAILFSGILTPTLSSPAVTTSGMFSRFFRMVVSGPGRNFSSFGISKFFFRKNREATRIKVRNALGAPKEKIVSAYPKFDNEKLKTQAHKGLLNCAKDSLGFIEIPKEMTERLLEHGLIEGENGAYGIYIKTVNGILADYDIDQSYWAVSKNGEAATTGVDGISFLDGEHYELVYTKM